MRAALLAAASLAVLAGCTPDPDPDPDPPPPVTVVTCPQEDTCEADWRHGAWWLRVHAEHTGTGAPGPWVQVSR